MPERPSLEVHRLRDLIRSFLADYLRIVESDSAAGLRLDGIELRRKRVDGVCIVAETAGRRSGKKTTILVRIEAEALAPPEASLRVGRSIRGLRLPYGEPLLTSLVYLQGGRPGPHLDSCVLAEVCGIELARLYFTSFGLNETRAEPYLERPEPLAWALAARMRPTQRTPDEHRRACLERIAAAVLDEKRRSLLQRSVKAPGSYRGTS